MARNLETAVAAHYATGDLFGAIVAALEAAGADRDNLRIEDIAPVDEFHTAGRITTLQALEMTPLTADMHVLDAGCGIGGTARAVATERGCRVTGVDLTPEFVDVARRLTELTGLSEKCRFEVASVLDMPFEAASFDAGLTFHVAMNIEDRGRFYAELARVLKPGAPLCVFDVTKGPAEGMLYPVPWAETEATSFLKSTDETCALLEGAGFEITRRKSLRDFAIGFFEKVFARAAEADGPPPVGLHLLTGANSPEKFANYLAAVKAGQIEPAFVIGRRV
ncbi:MAG: class I SAM-dependent methyltransferase [Maricaulaceae bacterium]